MSFSQNPSGQFSYGEQLMPQAEMLEEKKKSLSLKEFDLHHLFQICQMKVKSYYDKNMVSILGSLKCPDLEEDMLREWDISIFGYLI